MVISDSTALGHFLWVLIFFFFFVFLLYSQYWSELLCFNPLNECVSPHSVYTVTVSQSIWWRSDGTEDSSEGLNAPKIYTSESPLCSEDGCRVKAVSGRPSMSFLKYGGYLLYSPCSLKLVHIFFVFSSLSFSED